MSVAVASVDDSLHDRRSMAVAAPSARTDALLHGPIIWTLVRLASPNILVMLAQASTGLIETYFVARLGTDALAGMALAFPAIMLMQMISAGSMGGGISSAIARAIGAGRRDEADALVLHGIVIHLVLGLFFSIVMLAFGTPIYRALGGRGGELEAAVTYSNVVFAGNVLLWILNALASAIRGTGNMLVPALVMALGVVVLVPLSPCLIFGIGPFPALGIAGGGMALVLFNAAGTATLAWYILSGRNIARLRLVPLRWRLVRSIFGVGAWSSISAIQTNVIIAFATALVASVAGADAVAGYGTGARLEYLLIPLVFGLGAPLVALIGTNIGAGQQRRALHIGLAGAAIAFALTETIGVVTALFPHAWLALFSRDPAVIAAGSTYLRIVGPFYGFFGLGLSLYFASQGAGRLSWPLFASFLRTVVALGGGYLALRASGSLGFLFAVLAFGLFLQGMTILSAVLAGVWFSNGGKSDRPKGAEGTTAIRKDLAPTAKIDRAPRKAI